MYGQVCMFMVPQLRRQCTLQFFLDRFELLSCTFTMQCTGAYNNDTNECLYNYKQLYKLAYFITIATFA